MMEHQDRRRARSLGLERALQELFDAEDRLRALRPGTPEHAATQKEGRRLSEWIFERRRPGELHSAR